MSICKKIVNNNSIWAVGFLALKTICNFFLVPFLVKRIGMDQYGYIALANNFLLYIDLICVAFNYFAVRNIAVAYHKRDFEKANMYYSTILWADFALAFAIGIPCLVIIYFSDRIILISDAYSRDVKILFFLILIKYFVMLIGTILDVAAFIKNRLDISNKNKTFSYLFYIFTIIILLNLFEPRIWFIGIAALSEAVVYCGVQHLVKKRYIPDLIPQITAFSFSGIHNYLASGIWIAFNNMGNILNDGLDLMITNMMISENMVGMISIAKMLGNMICSIIVAISNSLKPKQLEDYSNGNTKALVDKLYHSMRLTGVCFAVFLAGFIGCGKAFLNVWLQGSEISTIYYLSLLAIMAYFIPSNVIPLYYVFTLTKKIKVPSYITITMGLANVFAMIALLKLTSLGGYAILLTTAILNLVHIIDTPIYAAYCLGIGWKTFYKPIKEHVIICFLCVLVGSVYSRLLGCVDTWLSLALAVLFLIAIIAFFTAVLIISIKFLNFMIQKKEAQ